MLKPLQNFKTHLDESGIYTVTLNRPDKLNALSVELLEELEHIIEQTKLEKKIKALLITGEGKAFCAGADIQQLAELNGISGLQFASKGQALFRTLELLEKPSLAAINGYAFGGGCELAMACTLRIASNTAQFGQPEVKLGVIPGYGGTQCLSRLIGKGRAVDMCISGRTITAEQALAWGLISEITAPDELLSRAQAILTNILAMSPLAVAHTMHAIDSGYDLSLDEGLKIEALRFALLCDTKDKREGVNAFLTKRKANFLGE